MRKKSHAAVALAASLALALTACGSDDDDDGDGGDTTTGPLKIGTFAPLTGPASATFSITPKAVEARFKAYEAANGECATRGFEFVHADDVSTAEGALNAAQRLIQQEKVDVIVHNSSFFYGASQFLTTQAADPPIFGGGFDGAGEYNNLDNNLLPVMPPPNFEQTYTSPGTYYKDKGVTKYAIVAYVSPSSQEGAKQSARSMDAAGIEAGYTNYEIPFGSSDVGAIVQGIISSGADGLYAPINPETTFAIVGGLKQAGYLDTMKIVQLATGYGSDLLANPTAVQLAQGVYFNTTAITPVELETDATKEFSAALKEYTGNESGVPSFSEGMGWLGADSVIYALEKAGCDASGKELLDAMRDDDSWDANGLMPAARDFGSLVATESCQYVVKLEGEGFVPDPDASPVCGKPIN